VKNFEEFIEVGCFVERIRIHGTFNFPDKLIFHLPISEVHLKDETHDAVLIDAEVE
jgi:hypothetical protein